MLDALLRVCVVGAGSARPPARPCLRDHQQDPPSRRNQVQPGPSRTSATWTGPSYNLSDLIKG